MISITRSESREVVKRTDRSRVLAYQACPRARYLGYHWGGRGLASSRVAVPLATGTYIHEGLAKLLGGSSIDEAAGHAVDAYREAATKFSGFQGIADDHTDYTLAEQAALTEALVRAYGLRGLPRMLTEYEVVEVEKEYEFELTPGVVWMARLDGLLRRRSDGELFVMSFKTDIGADLEGKLADARIDLQGLTEPMAAEHALGIVPMGVKMEWLIKGAWKEDERGSKKKYQQSYLVRPWRRLDATDSKFAWQYYWDCTEPHETVWKNGRRVQCPGGKTHGLGDSFQRVPIWELMTVKEWIEMLDAGLVQPELGGDPLGAVIYQPPPIYRNKPDQERRMRQLASQEQGVTTKLKLVEAATSVSVAEGEKVLDALFPQHDRSCNHPTPCQFKRICWPDSGRPDLSIENPMELGYTWRTPHHEGELIQIQEAFPEAA